MGRYILALDQGTSSSRAVLFDEEGRRVCARSREFPQHYPQPGWVEHDPEDIWRSQLEAARETIAAAGVSPRDIAAIGVTNQRETTVVWDRRTGEPAYRAIVWQCRRTADMCEQLRADGFETEIRRRTGLVVDAYFSGTKVAWILRRVPGARERAERGELAFGTVDSWLLYRLTGGRVHATDATNASRTMLFNLHDGTWDPMLLDALGVPAAALPEVVDSSGVIGEADPALFGAAIPIAGVAGDQQAALFGQGCLRAGDAKNTYGTGCFVLQHVGSAAPFSESLLTTVASRLSGSMAYALEGSVFVAGAAVQWLRDGLGLIRSAAEVEALAASVPSSEGVYVVPAFVGLGAPHWDMYARGAILGVTRGTTAAHIARATLESMAFQTRDVIEAMERGAGRRLEELRVDGGATRNDLLMQIQADVLGIPVARSAEPETTARGAAFLAGLAVGIWRSPDDVRRAASVDRVFEPRMSEDQRETLYAGWRRAVERAKGWAAG
ncbi:MAG TPA: glycerol kinase GlpK [Dehalococcoidia bacterium]|nr:glycerol kinase GlpK [Dehalococcoidia bacterium]